MKFQKPRMYLRKDPDADGSWRCGSGACSFRCGTGRVPANVRAKPGAVGDSDLSEGLGAGSEARETCPACGDHAAHKVHRLECNSCGCTLVSDWERAPSSPIDALLAEYAAECSDFSGQAGYEHAVGIARRYAERGPDSQMRCVVHTLLARLEAPNVGVEPHSAAERT